MKALSALKAEQSPISVLLMTSMAFRLDALNVHDDDDDDDDDDYQTCKAG